MLSQLFSRKYRIGAEHHLPEIARPLRKLQQDDAEPARRLMESTRNRAWDERHLYTSCFGDADVEHFEEWCRCDPLSPDPWLLRGMARISWAWDARTAGRASEVTEEGWRLFFQRLSMARRDLQWAAERLPNDPTPYIFQIPIHMGGGRGTEEIYNLFNEAIQRDPTSFEAHATALYALTEQWKGSHDEMFTFARAAVEKASPDNDLAAVLAYAHGLRLMYYLLFDEDSYSATQYGENFEVQREVALLFDQTFDMDRYSEGPTSFKAWNSFAFWFYKADDAVRLRRCLKVIKGRYAGSMWDYFNDPQEVLKKVERMARG